MDLDSNKINKFITKDRYELFLFGLIQHLFISIFLKDMNFYAKIIWPISMIILGVSSVGIFKGKGKNKILIKNLFLLAAIILPIMGSSFPNKINFFMVVSLLYTLFFGYLFKEIFAFLIRPVVYNKDVVTASTCGYLLLIEIFTFLFQFLIYNNPHSLNISIDRPIWDVFIDLVYFTTVSLTSTGYGDIVPTEQHTKLITAFMGLIGQFYTVVLTGILISNFAANLKKKNEKTTEGKN